MNRLPAAFVPWSTVGGAGGPLPGRRQARRGGSGVRRMWALRLAHRPQVYELASDRGTRGNGRADAAEHGHAQGPAAGACRKAGCHSPAQGHTRQRGDLPPRVEPVLMRELDA